MMSFDDVLSDPDKPHFLRINGLFHFLRNSRSLDFLLESEVKRLEINARARLFCNAIKELDALIESAKLKTE